MQTGSSLDLCISFISFADFVKRLLLPSLTLGGTTVALHTPNIQLLTGQLRLPFCLTVLCLVCPSQLGKWICLYKQKCNLFIFKSEVPGGGGEIFVC